MTIEGKGRKTHYRDGQWFDTIFLSMLKEEYLEKYGSDLKKN
jgi:RimJ/RimL family protein N-acetyltransferase